MTIVKNNLYHIKYSCSKEVLHSMNPLVYINDGSEDPRGNWKDDHFGPLKGRCFNIVRVLFIGIFEKRNCIV